MLDPSSVFGASQHRLVIELPVCGVLTEMPVDFYLTPFHAKGDFPVHKITGTHPPHRRMLLEAFDAKLGLGRCSALHRLSTWLAGWRWRIRPGSPVRAVGIPGRAVGIDPPRQSGSSWLHCKELAHVSESNRIGSSIRQSRFHC